MTITLNLSIARGDFRMQADLTLPGHGITALFGPSGSGKTTLLRAIAGLERHPGSVTVNGAAWQDDRQRLFLPTHRRALGYVFQEASLLAHLSVQDNLKFGWQRVDAAARKVDWERTLALLGIEHLLERRPSSLSGGERQRVAIARALLSSPALLLMDEPLASLDAARKTEVLPYLERLHQDLLLPIIYVSHAPDEVARLADHLVLIGAGGVLAHGPIGEISARIDLPPELDVSGAVVNGEVISVDGAYRMLQVRCGGATIALVHDAMAPGSRLRIRVLARDVSLSHGAHHDTSVLNQLPAQVIETRPAGQAGHMLVRLDAQGLPLVARITRQSHDHLQLIPGLRLWAQFKAAAVLSSGQG